MKSKIAQFNVRVPREIAHAMKVVATMLDVPVQQLGADAIAIYYGQADQAAIDRQRLALEAARRIFPGVVNSESPKSLGEQTSVKEPRLPLRQSPKGVGISRSKPAKSTGKIHTQDPASVVDVGRNDNLVTLPGLSFFREEAPPLPVAA